MRYAVVAVKDEGIGAFMPPQFCRSIGQAVRGFADEVNRPSQENVFFRHPEQFSLWHFGEWDDLDGKFHCEGADGAFVIAQAKNLSRTPVDVPAQPGGAEVQLRNGR